MSLRLGVHSPPIVDPDAPSTIKAVRAYVIGSKDLEEKSGGGADCHAQSSGHWITDTPIANPSSCFREYKQSRRAWGIAAVGTMIVEVELNSGVKGIGITIAGEPGCFVVEQHLSRFLEGQNINNIELMWDQMWRGSVNYGRKGLVVQAMSAVDLALWDALGHHRGEPVYNLLGGKSRETLPVYATTARPDLAQKMGFQGAKFPLPYGPADGDAGMRANIERIKSVRAAVGPDYPIMIDCYMSLTPRYTIELCRKIDREVPNGVKWIEEFLPPDEYDGYAEVKSKVSTTLLTTGEHEYTRYGFKQLLDKKCCDVLQPDITWCGGITEARRIYALASAYNVPCIPHGSSVYSFHLQITYPECPIGECLIMSAKGDEAVPYFGNLFTDEPVAVNGYVTLPNKPGFGVTLNRAELDLRRPYPREGPISLPDRVIPDQTEWLSRAGRIPIGEGATTKWAWEEDAEAAAAAP